MQTLSRLLRNSIRVSKPWYKCTCTPSDMTKTRKKNEFNKENATATSNARHVEIKHKVNTLSIANAISKVRTKRHRKAIASLIAPEA